MGRASLRKALLTAEVAITVVLLIAAGLLFKSFLRLRTVDLGCATKNVLTMTFFLRGDQYSKPEQIVLFNTELLDKVKASSGVDAAGLTNVVPGDGYYGDQQIWIPEHPPQAPEVHHFAAYRTADPGYFSAMQIPLIRGRLFSNDERLEHDKFVIVNQEFVRQYFSRRGTAWKHLRVKWRTPQGESYESSRYRKHRLSAWQAGTSDDVVPDPIRYSGEFGRLVLVVRSGRDVIPLAAPIQRLIASLDPNLPVKNVLTMEQIVGKSTANSSFSATLVLSFAGFSLLLAAVGSMACSLIW